MRLSLGKTEDKTMKISDFKIKSVPGLYSVECYEAPNGDRILKSTSHPSRYVYKPFDKEGYLPFETFKELKRFIKKVPKS